MPRYNKMPPWLAKLLTRDKETQTEHVTVDQATQVHGSVVDGGTALLGINKETQTDSKDYAPMPKESKTIPKYNRWSTK